MSPSESTNDAQPTGPRGAAMRVLTFAQAFVTGGLLVLFARLGTSVKDDDSSRALHLVILCLLAVAAVGSLFVMIRLARMRSARWLGALLALALLGAGVAYAFVRPF